MDRQADLAANYKAVVERVRAAATAAGRDPDQITIVVVSKTWPAADVRLLAELGVLNVGENRDQEASAKAAELAGEKLSWHFVGQLQRKKASSVAGYADYVHSIDREPLVHALDSAARTHGRRLGAFVQVNLEPGAGTDRGGADPADVLTLCGVVEAADQLDLMGIMAVAPLGAEPAAAFARLAQIRESVVAEFPAATSVSAGMSGDLEQAIAAGATHVRVGSAVLGTRRNVR